MIPTAEEFLKETSPNDDLGIRADLNHLKITKHVLEIMRRFAKLHVEAALKAKTEAVSNFEDDEGYSISEICCLTQDAYPLENIK